MRGGNPQRCAHACKNGKSQISEGYNFQNNDFYKTFLCTIVLNSLKYMYQKNIYIRKTRVKYLKKMCSFT